MKRGIDQEEVGGVPRRRFEAGRSRETIEKHPLAVINSVAQVRKEIHEDGIEELVHSIAVLDDDGCFLGTDMHQDPTVARFTEADVRAYLAEINDLWRTNHTVNELTPSTSKDGQEEYVVVVAGHRRFEALRRIEDKHDVDLDIHCVTYDGAKITFDRALKIQYNENFHKRPESYEDAAAINDIYAAGLRKNRYTSYADCARHLNIPADRVARAHRFSTLPQKVQEFARSGGISYGDALLFTHLCSAIAFNHLPDEFSSEIKDTYLKRLKENKVHLIDFKEHFLEDQYRLVEESIFYHLKNIGETKNRKKYIKNQIQSLLGASETISLFEELTSEESLMKEEQQRIDREMAHAAADGLRYIILALDYANSRRGAEPLGENKQLRGLISLAINGLGFKTKRQRSEAIAAARRAIKDIEQDEVLL